MILFFDTETTGLPDFKSPSDAPHQPHIVQMGAILTDHEFNEVERLDLYVRPEGWSIPDEVAAIHGVTNEIAMAKGVPEQDMLSSFLAMWNRCSYRVAFNEQFDRRILRIAMKRFLGQEVADTWDKAQAQCAMKMASPRCNLPPTPKMLAAGFRGPKQPKLSEAVKLIMGEDMVGAHSAIVDVEYTVRLYRFMMGK